jgi:fucose permease
MVAAGTLVGLGIGLTDAGVNAYLTAAPAAAGVLGLAHAFYGLGALAGPAVATAVLAAGSSWRAAYLLFAGMVGLLLAWLVLARRPPGAAGVGRTGEAGPFGGVTRALATPAVGVAALLLAAYTGVEATVGTWAFSVETGARGAALVPAGFAVSGYWAGLTASRLAFGLLVARLSVTRTLDLALAGLAVALVLWCLLPGALVALPLIGLALGPIYPGVLLAMPRHVPAVLLPAAVGLVTSAASLGATGIPTAVGVVADRAGLGAIPVTALPLAGLVALLYLRLRRA